MAFQGKAEINRDEKGWLCWPFCLDKESLFLYDRSKLV